MKAFYATLSETEIDDTFGAVPDFGSRQDLTAEQKQALFEMVEKLRALINGWRSEGAADARSYVLLPSAFVRR